MAGTVRTATPSRSSRSLSFGSDGLAEVIPNRRFNSGVLGLQRGDPPTQLGDDRRLLLDRGGKLFMRRMPRPAP
jgi:hypothetical protein